MSEVRTFVLRASKVRDAQEKRQVFNNRLLAAVAAVLLLAGSPAVEAQSPQAAAVDAYLEAGEFAPALHLAESAQGPGRDRLLSKIATAQARSGASRPSLATAAGIDDDRVRNALVQGGFGGGDEVDFGSLLELITTTVGPQSWVDFGGLGSAQGFENGIYVDAEGLLHRMLRKESGLALSKLRKESVQPDESDTEKSAVRRTASLRKVSLTRLEKHVQLRLASGRQPTAAMRVLAGLQEIQYVMIYPKTGDIVLAGPAGDWQADNEDRIVSTKSGRPVYRLEDLVVVLRQMQSKPRATFGCSITPTTDGIARTQAFLKKSAKTNIRQGQRDKWLEELRGSLGKQDIEIFGIDPRTRVARVLIEADYRMKLVGLGLEEGVLGVKSYLDMVHVPQGQAPPSVDVLRWWFTLDYDSVRTTESRDVFAFSGQGAQVLSENQLLTEQGGRVSTGKSDQLNRQFAESFTKHFKQLAQKYPVYAEMRNIFDLALVAALIKSEKLDVQVGWHQTCFGDPKQFQVSSADAPKQVDTVIAHRVINRVHVLAGVSGGVRIDPWQIIGRKSIKTDTYGRIEADRTMARPAHLSRDRWWWD